MRITIDNFDGAGPRDYTASLDAERSPRISHKLNRPSRLELSLVSTGRNFVVPCAGARVRLEAVDGTWFTGYTQTVPVYEYLGWGERGPAYLYTVVALSDEWQLDLKSLPERAPFTHQSAGDIVKSLAADLVSTLDTSNVEPVATLPSYAVSSRRKFSEHAADIALRSRASYRVHDGKLYFAPIGAQTYAINEADAEFSPESLVLRRTESSANDVTVFGRTEPGPYVKDYFLGDGLSLYYNLSHPAFAGRPQVVVDDEFPGDALNPQFWTLTDPQNMISVTGGKLRVAGGTGVDGATRVCSVEQVELGGAILLQHGEVEFNETSNGIVGGLYNGSFDLAHCFSGFRVTASGSQSAIAPVINGTVVGSTVTTQAGHRYVLSTRIRGTQPYRTRQVFHSSQRTAANPRGGEPVAADVRIILELHDIDPANAGTQAAVSTILYDGVIANAPAYCSYALINSTALHCTVAFSRILRDVAIDVAATVPGQPSVRKIVGSLSEGGQCHVSDTYQLQFYPQYVPAPNEAICVSYRGAALAQARVRVEAAVTANARGGDDGLRLMSRSMGWPAPRTSSDCETAALALLDDLAAVAWTGEYSTWSDVLPSGATDIFPGDTIDVNVPSRNAAFLSTVREVEIELSDPANDRAQYRLVFANDAAEPLAFELDGNSAGAPLDNFQTTANVGTSFLADITDAVVTSVSTVTIGINAGAAPPSGGGIEVRRSDYGWGLENDRNLVGRFTTQSFTLPRLSSTQTYYLRQYEAGSAPRYSHFSAVLHVNYPL